MVVSIKRIKTKESPGQLDEPIVTRHGILVVAASHAIKPGRHDVESTVHYDPMVFMPSSLYCHPHAMGSIKPNCHDMTSLCVVTCWQSRHCRPHTVGCNEVTSVTLPPQWSHLALHHHLVVRLCCHYIPACPSLLLMPQFRVPKLHYRQC